GDSRSPISHFSQAVSVFFGMTAAAFMCLSSMNAGGEALYQIMCEIKWHVRDTAAADTAAAVLRHSHHQPSYPA
ncbi:MAG TPA: hypothetical protein PK580_06075, partial [Nitrosomonas halophila]|nr:hypothetical protein [Nitrosomonas halophila]